jgi:ABC-type transport system involved in multi-copper enzyme maturation permease subunit
MRWAIEFPLVQRQMLQTAQKSTLWYVRGLLVVLQIIVGLSQYGDLGSGVSALGTGSKFIIGSTICNLLMIYLLMPLTACSAISGERSRQTLPLLLISRISPSRLLWEKFLWSLQPVFSMILASLPVLAIGYSLGGMPAERVALCALTLFIAAIQVNSAAIFWSSLTDKSINAFWGTIFLLFLLICFPAILSMSLELREINLWGLRFDFGMLFSSFWMLTGESVALWPELAIVVGPPLGMAVFLLSMSGLLISRYRCEAPFVCWHRSLKEFFHGLWHRSHEPDLVSPVRSGRPRATARTLPGYHPIAWREYRASITTKPTTHVALGVSLLALVYWMQSANFSNSVTGLAVLLKCILLFVGILQVQSLASRAIGHERERETLQLLLTTPLTIKEILQQKFAAASRVRYLLMIPFAALSLVSLTSNYWPNSWGFYRNGILRNPLLAETLVLLIVWQQLSFTLRLAGFCSASIRATMRAAATSVGLLAAWWLGQMFCIAMLDDMRAPALIPCTPIGALTIAMGDERPNMYSAPLLMIAVGMGITEILSLALWRFTLAAAPMTLERTD